MIFTAAKKFVARVGRVPMVSNTIRRPSIRAIVGKLPGSDLLYGAGWGRIHPYDIANGIDTSGNFESRDLQALSAATRAFANVYAGCQPSVLRTALSALPPVDSCAFVDLGCGKGRAVLVASEFPFREIVGVEMSPSLALIAVRNAAEVARRYPGRTAVRIEVGDATAFPIPAGDFVLFLYNPFKDELMVKVVAAVEAALKDPDRAGYIVSYNPVTGHLFDASPSLRRRLVATLPYAADEVGYGPDAEDPLIIWQGGNAPDPAHPPVSARIDLDNPNRAVLRF